MESRREPWYATCCKTLALRRRSWKQLDDAWEEQSSDSETGSTKSGSHVESSPDAAHCADTSELARLCKAAAEDEEFFSDTASDEDICAVSAMDPRPVEDLHDFQGHWVCTSTWGLEDFLKKSGFSRVQRMAASRAPWPEWEFEQQGSHFVFINRGTLGDIREEFVAGGPEYEALDGWKQAVRSKAHWEDGALIIERSGPQGCFREERRVDQDGKLQFHLHALKDGSISASFGRSFKRKS